MGALLLLVWYMIAVLPFLIFLEGNKMLADFLKKKNIYQGWDVWHSTLVLLIILFIIFYINGY